MAAPFNPQLKQEIIAQVKAGSLTQAEACRLYGVSSASMSLWCRQDVVGGEKSYITQINQLKRELDKLTPPLAITVANFSSLFS